MITSSLLEVVFQGLFFSVNFDFLPILLANSKEIRFNSPKIPDKDYKTIVKNFQLNEYADLVITTDKLRIKQRSVKNSFINIGRDGNKMDLLLYFDRKDIGVGSDQENIDYLKDWAFEFKAMYNFDYFICRMDNAGENEYYFDSNQLGPFYKEIS